MDLTPETLGAGAVGLIVILGALGQYLRTLRAPQTDPVIHTIGMEYGNREQQERQIEELRRIANALEILADKRTTEFEDMHRALLDRLDAQERREEQEEQKPRSPRPHHRRPP